MQHVKQFNKDDKLKKIKEVIASGFDLKLIHRPEKCYNVIQSGEEFSVSEVGGEAVKMNAEQFTEWQKQVHENDMVFMLQLQVWDESELAYEIACDMGTDTSHFKCDVLHEIKNYLKPKKEDSAIVSIQEDIEGRKEAKKGLKSDSVKDDSKAIGVVKEMPVSEEPYEQRRLKRVRYLDGNNLGGGRDCQREWLF